jgi:hypothetical protein
MQEFARLGQFLAGRGLYFSSDIIFEGEHHSTLFWGHSLEQHVKVETHGILIDCAQSQRWKPGPRR